MGGGVPGSTLPPNKDPWKGNWTQPEKGLELSEGLGDSGWGGGQVSPNPFGEAARTLEVAPGENHALPGVTRLLAHLAQKGSRRAWKLGPGCLGQNFQP